MWCRSIAVLRAFLKGRLQAWHRQGHAYLEHWAALRRDDGPPPRRPDG